MSIKAKGRERPGLVLAAGALLSSLGVVMVALVCCGIPVLAGATSVFAAAAPIAGNLWIIAAAALTAAVLLTQAQRRNGSEQSRPGAPARDAGLRA
ncbi:MULTISPECIES: hypothetical protein [unclassified Arthrobacter]|uniref:hypothetical protein n=1 Tax=unclassified Arthrobacter TaxID=235627 RepID=UPI00196B5D24|nr:MULTISPECIES: hypothetical protein [unclassified Arthrobacter]